jgi:hypothetical protein
MNEENEYFFYGAKKYCAAGFNHKFSMYMICGGYDVNSLHSSKEVY